MQSGAVVSGEEPEDAELSGESRAAAVTTAAATSSGTAVRVAPSMSTAWNPAGGGLLGPQTFEPASAALAGAATTEEGDVAEDGPADFVARRGVGAAVGGICGSDPSSTPYIVRAGSAVGSTERTESAFVTPSSGCGGGARPGSVRSVLVPATTVQRRYAEGHLQLVRTTQGQAAAVLRAAEASLFSTAIGVSSAHAATQCSSESFCSTMELLRGSLALLGEGLPLAVSHQLPGTCGSPGGAEASRGLPVACLPVMSPPTVSPAQGNAAAGVAARFTLGD